MRPFTPLPTVTARAARWLTPLLLGLATAAVAAPPPPIPVVASQNDGYVDVKHPDADSFVGSDPVCPFGARIMRSWRGDDECVGDHGNSAPLVHVQDVLDQRFGKGRAQAVGYAPVTATETVIFVRLTPAH